MPMPGPRDYYDVLGLSRAATADEIKSAYRKLARQLHPDANKAPDAAKKFAELQHAYEVLSDEERRRNYDRFGVAESGFAPGSASAGNPRRGAYTWTNVAGRPTSEGSASDYADFDAASIFEEMFGSARADPSVGGPFGARAKARSKPTKGADVHQDLPVDFIDAARGATRAIRIARGGATQTIDVTIPIGVAEGTKLRVRGAGSPSSSGGPPGDLILVVRIQPHQLFTREGMDILVDLPITIVEAALGAQVHLPTLTGQAELRVPAGTSSGAKLRLRGQGIRPHEGPAGDLYAIIKIIAPKGLNDEDQALLRKLGERLGNPRTANTVFSSTSPSPSA